MSNYWRTIDWTLTLAVFGSITGTLALLLQWRSYVNSKPRLKVKARFDEEYDIEKPERAGTPPPLLVEVSNIGGMLATVILIHGGQFWFMARFTNRLVAWEPPLPQGIAPGGFLRLRYDDPKAIGLVRQTVRANWKLAKTYSVKVYVAGYNRPVTARIWQRIW